QMELSQNYPNPCNSSTTIQFHLLKDCEIKLVIHNILGKRIRVLESGTLAAGDHQTIWDSKDDLGEPVCSGIYFGVLKAGSGEKSIKIVLIK
ncbi:MAG TPA: hypothetical protein DEO84_06620, partial [candidate division Zixibacteria bacterium]|nr:hypothetical protein [candidate division Zixibacteria bacterium]